jgi:hypothetical protein
LEDVRAALRLVGECRDLGHDPALWMRHAFEGLSGLAGARVVMGGEAHWPRPAGPITPILPVFLGMSQAVEGNFICHVRERGLVAEAIGRLPGRLVTRTRRQLLADRAWYRSPQYEGLHRPNGIDHCVMSVWELPGERTDLIGLHRAAGERASPTGSRTCFVWSTTSWAG